MLQNQLTLSSAPLADDLSIAVMRASVAAGCRAVLICRPAAGVRPPTPNSHFSLVSRSRFKRSYWRRNATRRHVPTRRVGTHSYVPFINKATTVGSEAVSASGLTRCTAAQRAKPPPIKTVCSEPIRLQSPLLQQHALNHNNREQRTVRHSSYRSILTGDDRTRTERFRKSLIPWCLHSWQ